MERWQRIGILLGLLLPAVAWAQESAVRTFAVDPAQSDIQWLVYKAGAFARFGHNHVISVGMIEGSVELASDPAQSSWSLSIPVAGLIIDDPQRRAAEGEEFASEPSEEDIAGTRTNMLSETVLNGDVYPLIVLHGTGFDGNLDNATLDTMIEMLGREIPLQLPANIEIQDNTLIVSGAFSLTHAELGMMPFSVMMGALQVGEQLDFRYRIHAVERSR